MMGMMGWIGLVDVSQLCIDVECTDRGKTVLHLSQHLHDIFFVFFFSFFFFLL